MHSELGIMFKTVGLTLKDVMLKSQQQTDKT